MAKQTISNAEPWSQFYGPNLGYVMEKYEQYLEDPDSVDPELKQLFEQWGAPSAEAERFEYSESAAKTHQTFRLPENPTIFSKLVAAVKLADNIRHYGHLAADVNPLNKQNKDSRRIELSEFDLTEEDLKEIPVPFICPHAPSHVRNGLDAINHLRKIYTDKIAFEFSQVHNLEEKTG